MCYVSKPLPAPVEPALAQEFDFDWQLAELPASRTPASDGSAAACASPSDAVPQGFDNADMELLQMFTDEFAPAAAPSVKAEPEPQQSAAALMPAPISPAAMAMAMAAQMPMAALAGFGAPFAPAMFAAPAAAPAAPAAPPAAAPTRARAAAAKPAAPRGGKPSAEAVERVKEKRRQSAQRSRQRKSQYIRALERENVKLKQLVDELRAAAGQQQGQQQMAA